MSDILISGYYGFANSGDDALLLAIIRDLKEKKPDADIVVLSASPEETKKKYNVDAIGRMKPLAVIKSIAKTKLLISGGGTLIQDGTSTASLFYYLTIITLAKLFGKKIMLYSNGIGPLNEKNKKLTKKILSFADVITLRDKASEEELKAMGVKKPRIILTADPAFSLDVGKREKTKLCDEKYVCVSVRDFKGMGEDFVKTIAMTADSLYKEYGLKTVLLPMQYPKDSDILSKIKEQMKTKPIMILKYLEIDDMLSIIKESEFVIGMRLHSLIYAVSMGVGVLGLSYDVKVDGFMDYIGEKRYIDAKSVTTEELLKMAKEVIEKKDEIVLDITKKADDLRKKAKENASFAIELL